MGGAINVAMLPSPSWFSVVDLVFGYLPMAWIGGTLTTKIASTAEAGA